MTLISVIKASYGKVIKLFSVILFLSMIQSVLFAQNQEEENPPGIVNLSGADIQAFTFNGKQFRGELLSVRENSLMIFNSSACGSNYKQLNCVGQIKKDDIQKVIIEGSSYVLAGIGAGGILGLISLAVTMESNTGGFSNIPRFKYSEGVTVGAVLGCIIVGGIVGWLASTPDEIIEPFSEYDISGLSVYAKYPDSEPEYLKQIVR